MPPNEPTTPIQPSPSPGDIPTMTSPAAANIDLKPSKKNPLMAVIIVLLVILIGVGIYAIVSNHKTSPKASTTSGVTTVEVSITKDGFNPATVTVSVGEPVIWTNNDASPHQVASDPYPTDNALSSFNSQSPLSSGQAFSYIFNKGGTYTYHDNLNPYTIKGTVVVKP